MPLINHTIDLGELGDVNCIVDYDYLPKLRSCDPYVPDDEEEITVNCVTFAQNVEGLAIKLLQDDTNFMEDVRKELSAARADRADFLRQLKRDEDIERQAA